MVAIHVLGMVDEVRALPEIAQQVKVEENPKVAKELRAVGRHLHRAPAFVGSDEAGLDQHGLPGECR